MERDRLRDYSLLLDFQGLHDDKILLELRPFLELALAKRTKLPTKLLALEDWLSHLTQVNLWKELPKSIELRLLAQRPQDAIDLGGAAGN